MGIVTFYSILLSVLLEISSHPKASPLILNVVLETSTRCCEGGVKKNMLFFQENEHKDTRKFLRFYNFLTLKTDKYKIKALVEKKLRQEISILQSNKQTFEMSKNRLRKNTLN